MIIRKARPEDNDRLLEIERHAPQGNAIKLLSERQNYFTRADRFDDPIMIVAEDEMTGDILGIMGVGPVHVLIGGQPAAGGLIFDWRSTSLIKKGLPRHMFRIWEAVLEEVKARQFAFLFGYIKEDNIRSFSIITRFDAKVIEHKEFLIMPVHRAFARLGDYPVTISHGKDSPAGYRDHDLFPLDAPMRQKVIDQYQFAQVSVGASSLKIWDSTRDYAHRVIGTPRLFRLAKPVFDLLSHLFPLPHIPSPGETIRDWYLYDLIIDKPADLAVLLEKTRQLAREQKIDYIIPCLSPDETLYRAATKYAWLKQRYNLLFLPLADLAGPVAPTYFDMRYI